MMLEKFKLLIGEVIILVSLKIKWKSALEKEVILVKKIFENCWEESDFIVRRGYEVIMFSKILFSKTIILDSRLN